MQNPQLQRLSAIACVSLIYIPAFPGGNPSESTSRCDSKILEGNCGIKPIYHGSVMLELAGKWFSRSLESRFYRVPQAD